MLRLAVMFLSQRSHQANQAVYIIWTEPSPELQTGLSDSESSVIVICYLNNVTMLGRKL